jgi:type I restriction enzyme S subunit
MSLKLDKSTWKRVTLGEVAAASKEKIDPTDGSVERYVAGEHMDTDDLAIHRWGNVGETDLGPAFHRMFRAGQVLYGSRRTYLRKVAVAEFDGVCANTTYVVETKNDGVLLQQFLPFVMTSEAFHAFAIAESKGSVNPYVNWSDIERYEFDLPPLDEQKRITGLLWAVERHRRNVTAVLHHLKTARERLNEVTFQRWMASGTTDLENLYDFQIGKRLSPEGRARGGDPFPYITNFNVQWRHIDFSEVREMAFLEREQPIYEIKPGDVLACEARFVGRSAVWPDERPGHMYQMSLHRLRHRDGELQPHMLVEFLDWCARSGYFKGLVGDNLIPHLPEVRFRKLAAPNPPALEAQEFEAKHEALGSAINGATTEVSAVGDLSASLLADIFEGM